MEETRVPWVPPLDEMESAHHEVGVCTTEDGQAMAVTGCRRRALAAINAHYRVLCEMPNLAGRKGVSVAAVWPHLETRWFRFWPLDGPYPTWDCAPAAQGDAGAVPVVWWDGQIDNNTTALTERTAL